jgi:hypothetical protein
MQRIFIMASNHVSLPHNPSSSNTNKNHGSFPLYSWLHLFFFFFNSNFSLLSIHSPSFSFISLSTIHLFTYCNLISFNMLYNNINKCWFFFAVNNFLLKGIQHKECYEATIYNKQEIKAQATKTQALSPKNK